MRFCDLPRESFFIIVNRARARKKEPILYKHISGVVLRIREVTHILTNYNPSERILPNTEVQILDSLSRQVIVDPAAVHESILVATVVVTHHEADVGVCGDGHSDRVGVVLGEFSCRYVLPVWMFLVLYDVIANSDSQVSKGATIKRISLMQLPIPRQITDAESKIRTRRFIILLRGTYTV